MKSELELLTQPTQLSAEDRRDLGFSMGVAQKNRQLSEWLESWIDRPLKEDWPNAREARDACLFTLAKWLYGHASENREDGAVVKMALELRLTSEELKTWYTPDKPKNLSTEAVSVIEAFEI